MSQENNPLISFDQLSLHEGILRALQDAGLSAPTEIQARAIPLILEGRDVIGRSHTGTGKTFAFGIPAVEHCLSHPELQQTQVLILCPTRELAMQVCGELRRLTRFVEGVRVACVYGGQPIQHQIPQLRRGAEIVVGTPGRVLDHIHRKTLRPDSLRMVVLDEADEMLNMGFREDIEHVLTFLPGERQILLFSATMPQEILDITEQYQNAPVLIETASSRARTIATVKQYYYEVPIGQKSNTLVLLLRAHEPKRCIVFCNTKKMADELTRHLTEHDFHCSCLHGDLKQEARTAVMHAFKSGRTPVLVATDVAARGIDVDDVDAVYNYDIPLDYEFYIHRVGRTGRAGKEGVSYTLAAGRRQAAQLRDISRFTGAAIERLPLPSAEEIVLRRKEQLVQQIQKELDNPSDEKMNALVCQLMELTSPERLAEALLALLLRQELANLPAVYLPRTDGKQQGSPLPPVPSGYVRLRVNVGRFQRIAPNHIVAALAEATRIPGKMIQKIYCYGDYSLVEVPSKFKNLILRKGDSITIKGHSANVSVCSEDDSTPHIAQPADTGVEPESATRPPRSGGGRSWKPSGNRRLSGRKPTEKASESRKARAAKPRPAPATRSKAGRNRRSRRPRRS